MRSERIMLWNWVISPILFWSIILPISIKNHWNPKVILILMVIYWIVIFVLLVWAELKDIKDEYGKLNSK